MIVIGGHGLWAQNLTITNVRIIVGNGQVIEQRAIVVRNGRILSSAEGASSAAQTQAIDKRAASLVLWNRASWPTLFFSQEIRWRATGTS